YRKTIKGVAYLRKHGMEFAITSVSNRKNIKEMEDILKLGIALGAKEMQVIRFMPGGAGMDQTELMLTDEEYRKLLKVMDRISVKFGVFCAMGAPNVPCRFPEKGFKKLEFGACSAGIDWFVIDPSGRMRICNHSPTILGDLKTISFEEIWDHPILKAFRNLEVIPDECEGCEKRTSCRGGCRAVAETLYGSLYARDPLMEAR
ncbi:MAG: SPASM domain-containing protein, partial [Thermoplasmatota archaeon]